MVFQARGGVDLGSGGGSGVGEKWTDLGLCLEADDGEVWGKERSWWWPLSSLPGNLVLRFGERPGGGSRVRTVTEVPPSLSLRGGQLDPEAMMGDSSWRAGQVSSQGLKCLSVLICLMGALAASPAG